jgi:hypothetical protein
MSRKMKKVKRMKIKTDIINASKITFDEEGSALKSAAKVEKEHLSRVLNANGRAETLDNRAYDAAELDAKIRKRIGEVTKKMLDTNQQDKHAQKERLKEKHRKKKLREKQQRQIPGQEDDDGIVATLAVANDHSHDESESSNDDNDDNDVVLQSVEDQEDIALQLLKRRRH